MNMPIVQEQHVVELTDLQRRISRNEADMCGLCGIMRDHDPKLYEHFTQLAVLSGSLYPAVPSAYWLLHRAAEKRLPVVSDYVKIAVVAEYPLAIESEWRAKIMNRFRSITHENVHYANFIAWAYGNEKDRAVVEGPVLLYDMVEAQLKRGNQKPSPEEKRKLGLLRESRIEEILGAAFMKLLGDVLSSDN